MIVVVADSTTIGSNRAVTSRDHIRHHHHRQQQHHRHCQYIARRMTDTTTTTTNNNTAVVAVAPGDVIDADCLRALAALATSKYNGDGIVLDEAFCRSMSDEQWRRAHQLALGMTEAVVAKGPREGAVSATSPVSVALHRAARVRAQHPKTTAQRAVHELQRRELEAAATPQQACEVRARLLEDQLLTGQAKLMRLSSENAELRRVADSLRAQYNEQLNTVAAIKQQMQKQQQQQQPAETAGAVGSTVVASPALTHARVDALLGDSEHQAHVLDDLRRRAEHRAAPPPPPMPQPPPPSLSGDNRRIARLTPEQAAATKHASRTVLANAAAGAVARDGGGDLVKQLASAVLKRRPVIGNGDGDDGDANDDEAWATSAAAHANIKQYVRRHRHRHRHVYARHTAATAVAYQPPLF